MSRYRVEYAYSQKWLVFDLMTDRVVIHFKTETEANSYAEKANNAHESLMLRLKDR